MNKTQAREMALNYVRDDMGWKDSKTIGCLPDPIVQDTFLVAVEIQRTKRRKERFAILISYGEVADDGFLMSDFVRNGGVLDEQDRPKKRRCP